MHAVQRPTLKAGVQDFQRLWGSLEHDISLLLTDPTSPQTAAGMRLAPEAFYNAVYKLCTAACTNVPALDLSQRLLDWGDRPTQPQAVYFCVRRLLEAHVRERLLPAVRGYDEELLHQYHGKWAKYSQGVVVVDHFCVYLNRDLLQRQNNARVCGSPIDTFTVKELGLICWKEQLYAKVKKQLLPAVLQQITRDRRGERVDTGLLKGVLQSFVQLGLGPPLEKKETQFYEEHFEALFLEESERYYAAEVAQLLQEHTLPEYMVRVERCLAEEQRRVALYLHRTTEEPLMKVLVRVMIENRQEVLLSECAEWFDHDMVDEQKRLYVLLSRSENGLEPLRKIVEDRIDADGKLEIEKVKEQAQRDPALFVETLLQVHHKYETMVNDIFLKDAQFVSALEKGCRRFINRNALSPNAGARSAELLAKYCHALLKPAARALKVIPDTDVDRRIAKVLTIFRLLEDKDVFQKFYSSNFSRRLIQHQYTPDMESNMITRLKEVCGYEYTYRLQRMFTDMDVSADLNKVFQQHLAKFPALDVGPDFSAVVLTSGSWPLNAPKYPFPLPPEVERRQATFEEFYRAEHNGRKLSWLHQHSHGILRTNYVLPLRRTYELQVSAYQMAVLLLFNDPAVDTIPAAHIMEAVPMPEKDLGFQLQTLVKHKILLTGDGLEPGCAALDPDQTFALNQEFKSPHRKVPLHMAAPKDAADDATLKLVSTDRKHAIQAAVVRVLKARRHITHQNLVAEVLSQLKGSFKPSVQDIKKNIDNLIEKEYMERAENVPNAYNYIA
jgi:cullin 1